MLENLGLVATFLCALTGGFLVYIGTTPEETMSLVSGAVVFAIGAIGFVLIIKEKLEWRQKVKSHFKT